MAALLARVSMDFVAWCEQEDLIHAQASLDSEPRYSMADVYQLARIRRLRRDLGLDWPSIEIVLNLRQQVLALLAEIDEIEQRAARRELIQEADWRA
jgi:DNA-binding transcriptional MerR regulator